MLGDELEEEREAVRAAPPGGVELGVVPVEAEIDEVGGAESGPGAVDDAQLGVGVDLAVAVRVAAGEGGEGEAGVLAEGGQLREGRAVAVLVRAAVAGEGGDLGGGAVDGGHGFARDDHDDADAPAQGGGEGEQDGVLAGVLFSM
nr:hypothetical protein [Nannocystis exedens]